MNLIDRANKYQEKMAAKVVAAKVNQELVDLLYIPREDDNVELVDISSIEGIRVYRNTLKFVLIKAIDDVLTDSRIKINYSINKGGYCELVGNNVTYEMLQTIKKRMKKIINSAMLIEKHSYSKDIASKILFQSGREDRVKMLKSQNDNQVILYSLGGVFDYFYGVMAPDASYVDIFDLLPYDNGFLLLFPDRFSPGRLPDMKNEHHLSEMFAEYKEWGKILGVEKIGDLNEIVESGKIKDLILVSEALQEKKIAYIADHITNQKKKFAFIAGPSSSGKTTFAKRLLLQLKANGLHGSVISLDNYYKGFGKIPYDIEGKLDYESIDGLDLDLLKSNVTQLLNEGKTKIPIYDFSTETVIDYRDINIDEKSVIIFEGIHGLNPSLYEGLPMEKIHKIYISALTSINIDYHNRLPSTDTRLIRRIVRDYQYRGAKAERTLSMWSSVRKGEDKYIFPYQDDADDVFNSSLIYEHGVLKKLAIPILEKVSNNDESYSEAERLLELLSYFREVADNNICITSILREFIGGSVFR